MASGPMSGATVNGRKPIAANVVHDYSKNGSSKDSTPKASQIAGMGARDPDPGAGKHIATPGQSKPELAGSPEVQSNTTGTTVEEQRKRLAGRMYPSSRGLRQYRGD